MDWRPFSNRARRSTICGRSVAAANAAVGLAILQYQLGTRDFTTVLTAEQNLYTAQNDLAMAEGNVSTGLAAVYRGAGGRMADPRQQRVRTDADGRRNAQPHQLGRSAAAARTSQPQPAPGLPTPANVSAKPRLPEW